MSATFLEIANRWVDVLNSGRIADVVGLYASNTTFHPTLQAKFIRDTQGTHDYFDEFLGKLPKAAVIEDEIRELGKSRFLWAGVMRIDLTHPDLQQQIRARFTFVWEKIDENWQIVHHHNSISPD